MTGKLLRGCVYLLFLLVLFLPREMAYAQAEEGATTEVKPERVRLEIGVRQLFGDRRSSKFNEYREIPQGVFIQHAEVSFDDLLQNTFFFNFQTRYARQKDQSYLVDFGRHRKYRMELTWDQTPHVFTTTAKTFFVESSPGVFTTPGPLRTLLQSQPSNIQAVLDNARPLDLSLRRDIGAGTFTYTPAEDWAFQIQYSKEKKAGYRPFGTTTNRFTNITELPEPIDYRTHEVKAGTEYANKRWGFQTSYSASIFNNQVSTLVWDNPFRTTDILGGGSQGRLDLYPDNSAHSLSFAGAVNIPHSTRLMASIVPGWMRQNDAFLPFTINTAIPSVTPPGTTILPVPSLPASSLNGSKQTLAMNYTLTSKAIPAVPLTFRYRSYDYNNNTPALIFRDWVITDAYSYGIARRNPPFAYDRKTLGVDASWDFLKNSSWKFLYEWERFDREFREVDQSHEHTVGTSFDFNPRDWFLLRGSYKHSQRDPEEYNEEEFEEEAFPFGEGPERDMNGVATAFPLPQIPSARKFDQAARKRHRVEALLQLSPVDQFSFSASYGTTQDSYDEKGCIWLGFDQCYGLLKDINYNYTFELTYTPSSAFSFFAEYTREKYKYRQRNRQRSPASVTTGAPANDHPNNDWETDRRDLVDTWAAGLDYSLRNIGGEDKVILNAFYSLSAAKNSILTRALGDRTLPLRDPRVPAFLPTTAVDYPDTSNRWHQVAVSAKFPLKAGFTPKLEYRYEKYDRVDFQLVNVAQYFINDPSTVTGVFLGVGADVPGYHAHIISASLEYRF